jgi:hypothetical protein
MCAAICVMYIRERIIRRVLIPSPEVVHPDRCIHENHGRSPHPNR